jgi:ABC-type transport system involved in cytochrome c biogenesis ATPase subunit
MPIKLKSATSNSGNTHLFGHLTVLVGPNNCGKSRTLRDIREFVVTGLTRSFKTLSAIEMEYPPEAETMQEFCTFPHASPGHVTMRGVSYDLLNTHDINPNGKRLSEMFSAFDINVDAAKEVISAVGPCWIAHLDAESRFKLANPTPSYDLRTEAPSNALQAFCANRKSVLPELRSAFRHTFGMDIALDWSSQKNLYLRIGTNFGDIPEEWDKLTELMKDAENVADQGDGYRSLAGVVLAMTTFPNRILLLDEPEAFLHPAQARALGRWLAGYAAKRSAQIILATHNADFLWGAVSTGAPIDVIRLNRTENFTSFHPVPSDTLKTLTQSPLLSSQPIMNSLFQKGVVVCEGDPDRAVYQAVAHDRRIFNGGDEVLFIHTNGKDTIKGPLVTLQQSGTPACAIVDIDILNSESSLSGIAEALTGKPMTNELKALRGKIALCVENSVHEDLLNTLLNSVAEWQRREHSDVRQSRRSLRDLSKDLSKWDVVKKAGGDFFQGEDAKTFWELVEECKKIGIFIVHKGELEGWIDVGTGKGKKWNQLALERLHSGGCPNDLKHFIFGAIASMGVDVKPVSA